MTAQSVLRAVRSSLAKRAGWLQFSYYVTLGCSAGLYDRLCVSSFVVRIASRNVEHTLDILAEVGPAGRSAAHSLCLPFVSNGSRLPFVVSLCSSPTPRSRGAWLP